MTKSSAKNRRQASRRCPLTLESFEDRLLLAADLQPFVLDASDVRRISEFGFELGLIDISDDAFLENRVLNFGNGLDSSDSFQVGETLDEMARWRAIESSLLFANYVADSPGGFDLGFVDLNSAFWGVDPPSVSDHYLETLPTPVESGAKVIVVNDTNGSTGSMAFYNQAVSAKRIDDEVASPIMQLRARTAESQARNAFFDPRISGNASDLYRKTITVRDLANAEDSSPTTALLRNRGDVEIVDVEPTKNDFVIPRVTISLEAHSESNELATSEMVDITSTLENYPANANSNTLAQLGFVGSQPESHTVWATNSRVISTTRVERQLSPAGNSVVFARSSHHPQKRTANADLGRAQAFEIVVQTPNSENTVSLAGVFHQTEYFSHKTTWNRYVPAHMAMSTLPTVFDMSSPEWQQLSGSYFDQTTESKLKPAATVQAKDATIGHIDEQTDEVRTDRRAATMIFSFFAVQQLWRSERRNHRWASVLAAAWKQGIDSVLSLSDLPRQKWDSLRRRWQVWQAKRHAPRPLGPTAKAPANRPNGT